MSTYISTCTCSSDGATRPARLRSTVAHGLGRGEAHGAMPGNYFAFSVRFCAACSTLHFASAAARETNGG